MVFNESLLAAPEAWPTGDVLGLRRESDGLPSLREMEAQHIARVLEFVGGRIAEAAHILGIHRNTLTRKIRAYGL
jgi:DNA-binding NtrC family response regulator